MKSVLLVLAGLCVFAFLHARDLSHAAPSAFVEISPDSSARTFESTEQDVEARLQSIETELATLRISKDYFGSILSAQLVIFSTIVVVLVAISWGISYFRAKTEVRKEFEKEKTQVEGWKRRLSDAQEKALNNKFEEFRTEIILLEASLNRAFATAQRNSPGVAYIWWLRAARQFHATGTHSKLTRICLASAQEALSKLTYRHELGDLMDEIQDLLSALDVQAYSYESKGVRDSIGRVYNNPFTAK